MVKKFFSLLLLTISCFFLFSGTVAAADGDACQFYSGSALAAGKICRGVCIAATANCSAVGNGSVYSQVQKKWPVKAMVEVQKGIDSNLNKPNVYGTSNNIFVSTLTSLAGVAIGPKGDANSLTGDSGVMSAGRMIGQLYTPPATANEYIADVLQDAGIATPAYAQGLGFSALSPVLETWKVFRTVAYFFYVVIFLVIGFMIMFRQKIGSQTVVTVQQALPKLLISLVAVTFSYAIAGFMIEIMYLAMFFTVNVFASSALGATSINGNTLQSFGTNSNIFNIAGLIINGNSLGNVNETVGSMVTSSLGLTAGDPGSILGSITGLAAVVIFAIALLFSIFRLFFELLKTYITIVIMIVTAPIALMLGALPGNNAFGSWLKGLFFNLAVFPAVLVVIIMAFLLQTSIGSSGGFLPPYIGGVGSAGAVAPLLGLGVLLIIPDIVEKVKKMAPAGPFDDLANKAGAAIKKGYSGGELIPGLGLSNTSKFPGGGLTGENILRKSAILAGGAAGAGYGAAVTPRGSKLAGAMYSGQSVVTDLAKRFNDKTFSPKKP